MQPTTEVPLPKQEFHITDEASANWVLRKLGNIEAEKQRVQAQAAAILRSLDADAARLMHLFGAELEAFARQRLEERGNRSKTLRLLQGTLAFRTVPASLRVADPQMAYIHCARSGLPCIREELDAAAYREAALKAFEEAGELLPGMEGDGRAGKLRRSFRQAAYGRIRGPSTLSGGRS